MNIAFIIFNSSIIIEHFCNNINFICRDEDKQDVGEQAWEDVVEKRSRYYVIIIFTSSFIYCCQLIFIYTIHISVQIVHHIAQFSKNLH